MPADSYPQGLTSHKFDKQHSTAPPVLSAKYNKTFLFLHSLTIIYFFHYTSKSSKFQSINEKTVKLHNNQLHGFVCILILHILLLLRLRTLSVSLCRHRLLLCIRLSLLPCYHLWPLFRPLHILMLWSLVSVVPPLA